MRNQAGAQEKSEVRTENRERADRPGRRWGLNLSLIQKLAVCVTLLVEAIFLFVGGCQVGIWRLVGSNHQIVRSVSRPYNAYSAGTCMDWGRTIAVGIGILLVGGVVTFLLGLISERAQRNIISSLSH